MREFEDLRKEWATATTWMPLADAVAVDAMLTNAWNNTKNKFRLPWSHMTDYLDDKRLMNMGPKSFMEWLHSHWDSPEQVYNHTHRNKKVDLRMRLLVHSLAGIPYNKKNKRRLIFIRMENWDLTLVYYERYHILGFSDDVIRSPEDPKLKYYRPEDVLVDYLKNGYAVEVSTYEI